MINKSIDFFKSLSDTKLGNLDYLEEEILCLNETILVKQLDK